MVQGQVLVMEETAPILCCHRLPQLEAVVGRNKVPLRREALLDGVEMAALVVEALLRQQITMVLEPQIKVFVAVIARPMEAFPEVVEVAVLVR